MRGQSGQTLLRNRSPTLLTGRGCQNAKQHDLSDRDHQAMSGASSQDPQEVSCCSSTRYIDFLTTRILVLYSWRLLWSGTRHYFGVSILPSTASTGVLDLFLVPSIAILPKSLCHYLLYTDTRHLVTTSMSPSYSRRPTLCAGNCFP